MHTNKDLDKLFSESRANLRQSIETSQVLIDGEASQIDLTKQVMLLLGQQATLLVGIYGELAAARHERRDQGIRIGE